MSKVSETNRRTCLCILGSNVAFKLEGVKKCSHAQGLKQSETESFTLPHLKKYKSVHLGYRCTICRTTSSFNLIGHVRSTLQEKQPSADYKISFIFLPKNNNMKIVRNIFFQITSLLHNRRHPRVNPIIRPQSRSEHYCGDRGLL